MSLLSRSDSVAVLVGVDAGILAGVDSGVHSPTPSRMTLRLVLVGIGCFS